MNVARRSLVYARNPIEFSAKLRDKISIGHLFAVSVFQVAHAFAAKNGERKVMRLVDEKRCVESQRCIQLEPEQCTPANQILGLNQLSKTDDMRLGSIQGARRQQVHSVQGPARRLKHLLS